MALIASEVRVAGTGEVFVAPVGTVAPTDASTALSVDWTGLGYTTDSGVSINRSVDREGITAWQSVTPVRYVYSAAELTVSAEFIQSNEEILKLYLGIQSFDGLAPNLTGEIPTIPQQDTRAMVLQWVDGDITNRLYIPKVEVSETGDVSLSRTEATGYSLTFAAVAPADGDALASWLTNDPAFAA